MYIDAHCHLDVLKDIDKAIERARKKRVSLILTNGVDPKTNRKALELANKFKSVKACLGLYPSDALKLSAKEINSEINFIKKNREKVFCIGEVGMDFKEDIKNKKKQEKNFEKFIRLAIELGIPVTVHSRKAEKECLETLEKAGARKVIMHYFSGKMKLANKVVEKGWFLSIPTAVKNSQHFQALIQSVPLENLLCETDSPWSHPDKEFPNEPGNVIESYKMIAKLKKLSLKQVEEQIEKNFRRLFINNFK